MSKEDIEMMLIRELKFLEEFRKSYVVQNPQSMIDREDPDVRRLIESMALFSAHTRLVTQRNLESTWRRLFSGYFDFMLNPLPAMSIAQATVTPRLVETVKFERGTEIKITTPSGQAASFCTTADLRVIPIAVEKLAILPIKGGSRMSLHLRSRLPRNESIGVLRLFVHCFERYEAALRIQYQLRAHLRRSFVVYDGEVDEQSSGPECQVTYGAYYDDPYEADSANGLERARSFFHFPEQDLYVNVQVPRHPQAWNRLALCFDLDDDWEPDPTLANDSFQLFTVPIANLRKGPSQPIICDGTTDAYPIYYVDPSQSVSLQSTRGVYRLTENGMEPLRPAVLAGDEGEQTYEIEERQDDLRKGHFLIVRMPRALLKPVKLVVEAMWHQPAFAREAIGRLTVRIPSRSLDGIHLSLLSDVRNSHDSFLRNDSSALLQLLSLRMKPTLTLRDITQVLSMFGTVRDGHFRRMPERIRDSRVELAPDTTPGSMGIRHVYTMAIERYEPEDEAMIWTFLMRVREILDGWNSEATVQLVANTGGSPLTVPVQ